eukprot:1192265-Prorocentrum_minimum.AAC.1
MVLYRLYMCCLICLYNREFACKFVHTSVVLCATLTWRKLHVPGGACAKPPLCKCKNKELLVQAHKSEWLSRDTAHDIAPEGGPSRGSTTRHRSGTRFGHLQVVKEQHVHLPLRELSPEEVVWAPRLRRRIDCCPRRCRRIDAQDR